MDCPGAQSQKEGQEEGTMDLGRGTPLAMLPIPGPPGLPSGSSLGGIPGTPARYLPLAPLGSSWLFLATPGSSSPLLVSPRGL